jgi:hypothetical protein
MIPAVHRYRAETAACGAVEHVTGTIARTNAVRDEAYGSIAGGRERISAGYIEAITEEIRRVIGLVCRGMAEVADIQRFATVTEVHNATARRRTEAEVIDMLDAATD